MYRIPPFLLLVTILSCKNINQNTEKLPSFSLLLKDGTSIFNTRNVENGKGVVFLFFSTDCKYCQHETEGILRNMNLLKNINFYFISIDPISKIRIFDTHFKLSSYTNIIVGRDYQFFMPKHFKINTTPYMAIYNKKQELFGLLEGEIDMNKVIDIIKKT